MCQVYLVLKDEREIFRFRQNRTSLFSTAEIHEVKGLRSLWRKGSQGQISLLSSYIPTFFEAKLATMSEKYGSEELFRTKKELEEMMEKKKREREEAAKEKKRQEEEDRLLAERLDLEIRNLAEGFSEHPAKIAGSTDEEMETDETDNGGDKIEQWDADVALTKSIVRQAASSPEAAKRLRKYLLKKIEYSPVKKKPGKGGKGGKVVKRSSPGRKKGKPIVGPEGSPGYAEEVDDFELTKAFGGLKSSSPEAPRKSGHTRHESGLPNNINETDDDAVDESWFPQPLRFEQEQAHQNELSTDIQLFKGMATQLVPTHGFFSTPYGQVEYWQQMLQERSDPSNNVKTTNIGLWTDKRRVGPNVVKPGDVIRATYSVAQNNTDVVYPNPNIRVFRHGPVYSKMRPLVVLWSTDNGMLCLPLYSCEWLKRPTTKDFWKAGFMTVITEECDEPANWEGYTPENGKPLSMIVSPGVPHLKCESFVSIDRPVSISRSEAVQYKQAKFTRESFVRLMEVYTHRENERKEEAFRDLGLKYPTAQPPRAPVSAAPGFEYTKGTIDIAKKRLKDIGLSASEIEHGFKS